MKILLTVCVLLIATPWVASAQSRVGLSRAEVKEAERRLAELGYWTGAVDGMFDPGSRAALIAYQKWEGRGIGAKVTEDELEVLRERKVRKDRVLRYAHFEVDLDRQVLLLVNQEGAVRVLPASAGSGKEFRIEGQTSVAYAPRGRFVVYD